MTIFKKLNWDEVVVLIEQCKYSDADAWPASCDDTECPLKGECLYYYTGDYSELFEKEKS